MNLTWMFLRGGEGAGAGAGAGWGGVEGIWRGVLPLLTPHFISSKLERFGKGREYIRDFKKLKCQFCPKVLLHSLLPISFLKHSHKGEGFKTSKQCERVPFFFLSFPSLPFTLLSLQTSKHGIKVKLIH